MNSKKVSEFQQLITHPKLRSYLGEQGLGRPTLIQKEAIPALLTGVDCTVMGKTGSGKTLSYLLPIIEKIKRSEDLQKHDEVGAPVCIIMVPTRELAVQVFGIAKDISHFAKIRVRKLVGGDKGKSLATTLSSVMEILVTTPERGVRSLRNGELKTQSLKYIILDEADQLLEPSFIKESSEFAQKVASQNPQTILVSASRPPEFPAWAQECFPSKKFKMIGQGEENTLNHDIDTYNVSVEEKDKDFFLSAFVKRQGKRNGIIFTGNKARAHKTYLSLSKLGNSKIFLVHKDLDAKLRKEVLQEFRDKGGMIVATDVLARGIDIPHLSWVLNYDLPSAADYYLHRVGRVGRAGRKGDVFNFMTSRDTTRLRNINTALTQQGRRELSISVKKKASKKNSKSF